MKAELLADLMEATWPPASSVRLGAWTIRDGKGGGKRVSAATADGDWVDEDIFGAEKAMEELGQTPMFLIREPDVMLDQALQARGYRVVDPVVAYTAPVGHLLETSLSSMAVFAHWPPLAVCRDIWSAGGIGPARWDVMNRVAEPKTAILARTNDRPAGVAFVAVHGNAAMLHALEVPQAARRQGSARNIMHKAAEWAQNNGAESLSLVVTVANSPARALYTSMGMAVTGQYHYRMR